MGCCAATGRPDSSVSDKAAIAVFALDIFRSLKGAWANRSTEQTRSDHPES